ncbi:MULTISPECIES: NAD(P)-binding protein [Edwardsiella]|uniref:NADPH-dependent glutamate synthase subunit beta-related oxidoreductase n=2 Tax=Edwardsiella anguillarum TaxID=1821960 RepID=A0A076LKA3_9GAMM|nr:MULTISPECIES: NAD(P)-binding protein [Edwardsiella]AIJ07058.1 NADPH-dependent glutamate synthase subunit beta-related oxidoreductase [Edwardsiella anguillarum ET080813]AKR79439.2 NAD(P)-binding protein [Edwardsiella sp. LADL05-105]KAB0588103.1 NAD(P)-binding protein [Edwardsiella anguillarum]WHP79354.1 NAD(P)-binding protein [Edwardsiella anguillarum]WHP82960.1 NAD(P)-binding protein [Edwardsiella anguillarum]
MMSKNQRDMTLPPDLGAASGTGPIRSQRPVYRDSLPPCNHACPAGENIQAWLALVQEQRYEEAWQSLIANNPMPAIHGRVCYHPCEQACNRLQADQPVSIHAVERFLGDMALEQRWTPRIDAADSGKKVLVIGAGPSGLSCAWHLRRLGHRVEIREAGPMPGGMMRFGIPAYRMPRDILDGEIDTLLSTGITLTLNHKVDDVQQEMRDGGFDAVFMAIGAHLAKKTDIPAREAGKILDAVGYLAAVERGEAPKLGRRVAIYGGGNTAMDAARTARRLGADEAMIIYRRDMAHMPAHAFEAEEAMEEGVKINWLRTIRNIDSTTVTVEQMTIDDQGRPQPTGRFETLQADSLILALGQDVDTRVLTRIPGIVVRPDGIVEVDEHMMTGVPGLFAGGDMVPSERTVTIATGHGKKAARHIDGWLRGHPYHKAPSGATLEYPRLHLWFKTDADASRQPEVSPEQRAGFDEIIGGLSGEQATYEAARCYSCGNCFECDGCYGACPEGAVIKLGKGLHYRFDYAKCTGCQACYLQCPCHAIEMIAEENAR